MSGDRSPAELIQGCVEASKINSSVIVAVGDEAMIQKELEKFQYDEEKILVLPSTEVITMEDHPASACRTKKDSSVMVGCRALFEGIIDAFWSPGNTGATLTASLLVVGRIKGVKRPAITIPVPTNKGWVLLLDAGANMDCHPLYLRQFAILGAVYCRLMMGVENPKVGLLNVGEEETKGNELALQAFEEIKKLPYAFAGNIEPTVIFSHAADVIVSDGFAGNVFLKTVEGTAKHVLKIIKEEISNNLISKFGALLMQEVFGKLRSQLDAASHGGAPLLGIAKPVYIGHGSSDAETVVSAVKKMHMGMEVRFTERMAEDIARYG